MTDKKIKIGILREGKIPHDRRVPLSPAQCLKVMDQYPGVEIIIQPSDIRCIGNKEYVEAGLQLKENLSDCDILMGIKEVPMHLLIPQKTFLFFSHTLKKQPHNQKLLQAVIEKKITLIDYEGLRDKEDRRVIAFGRFAGIVGTYNAFLLYGKKHQQYNLKPAHQCFDMQEVQKELEKISLPPIKIVVTGTGRVAKGAEEMLRSASIKKVSPAEYLSGIFDHPVYTILSSKDYHILKEVTTSSWDREFFYKHPEKFKSDFYKYARQTDVLIAGAYWNPSAPVLFTTKDMQNVDFRIKIIADITCDINGSIPCTIKPSNIYDPFYDFNPITQRVEPPFSDDKNISIMAIDNLPGELPRDASEEFGNMLINNVLPSLLGTDADQIIAKGMITKKGQLTAFYQYLQDYAFN